MPFCNACGKGIDFSKKFCTGCGKAIIVQNDQPLLKEFESNKDVIKNKSILAQIFNKQALIASTAIVALSVSAYFIWFNNNSETKTMYILAETLKLRSSANDANDTNVLTELNFSTPIKVGKEENGWLSVEYNKQKGYLHKKYLANSKDYYEIEGFIKNNATLDTITSTRFKLSILNYLRKNNYTSNLTNDIINTHFKDDELISTKEKWQIVRAPEDYQKTFITGKFINKSKTGIAILMQKVNSPNHKKVVVFNYDENDIEVSAFEMEANKYTSLTKVNKGEQNVANGITTNLQYDAILLEDMKTELPYNDLLLYNGIEIQKTIFEYIEGGC
jgi:hypothetical protein